MVPIATSTRRGIWRATACLVACSLLACCGTMMTRERGDRFGAYPFAAVASDLIWMSRIGEGLQENPRVPALLLNGPGLFVSGLLSLPIDLLLDSTMLPFDLVGWAMGGRKDWCPPAKLIPANEDLQPLGRD